MKNLKFRSIFFSLMAIMMVTVFLSSCKKDAVQPEVENVAGLEEESTKYFTLPSSFDEMSDEELSNYIVENDLDEDAILSMSEEVEEGQLEDRWCTSYYTVYTYCRYYSYCSRNYRKRLLKRSYCSSGNSYYYWTWGYCC